MLTFKLLNSLERDLAQFDQTDPTNCWADPNLDKQCVGFWVLPPLMKY